MRILIYSFILTLQPATALAADDSANGQSIYENRCKICHQPPKPESLSMQQWKAVLSTMQVRMKQKNMDPLSEQETADVLSFLEDSQ